MNWSEQRVLVTGATGFIGTQLVRRIVDAGADVWAGVYPGDTPERASALPAQVNRVPLDVRDALSVRAAVDQCRPNVVLHLAAAGVAEPGVDASVALDVNAGGAVRLLQALSNVDLRRVVLVGTCYEYGARETTDGLDPFNAYAASKAAAWAFGRMFWRAYGLPTVTVRPFQVYGPGQPANTLVPAAIRAALTGADLRMTPGEQRRDFVYVDDIAEGIVAAARAPAIDGESIDLGTGVASSVKHVVSRIWELTGSRGAMLAGSLDYRAGETMNLVADTDRTARLTGWRARTSLDDGLRRTIDEFSRVYAG